MQSKVYLVVVVLSALAVGGILANPTQQSECPNNKQPAECFADPCSVSSCPGDPTAACYSDYCECRAIWTTPRGKPAKCSVPTKCPYGQEEVKCLRNPCQDKTCPGYPDAHCVPNYCGGCYANWFGPDGARVQCGYGSNS